MICGVMPHANGVLLGAVAPESIREWNKAVKADLSQNTNNVKNYLMQREKPALRSEFRTVKIHHRT